MQRCQANRVFKRFGGMLELHGLLRRHGYKISKTKMALWRVRHSEGGTDGLIPHDAIRAILRIAKHYGFFLTDADWNPKCEPPPKKFYDRNITTRIRKRQIELDKYLEFYALKLNSLAAQSEQKER